LAKGGHYDQTFENPGNTLSEGSPRLPGEPLVRSERE
jgi:hypothetical protein